MATTTSYNGDTNPPEAGEPTCEHEGVPVLEFHDEYQFGVTWHAYCPDCFDGEPTCLTGVGKTKEEALHDYFEQVIEECQDDT
jgi:hypothetical protein